MPITIGHSLSFCGRTLASADLNLIRQVTQDSSRLSLTELSRTVCELLDWRRANGALKTRECAALAGTGLVEFAAAYPPYLAAPTPPLDPGQERRSRPTSARTAALLPPSRISPRSGFLRSSPVSPASATLSLPRLAHPLRRPAPLLGPLPATALSSAGLPALHQRRLEDGSPRRLDRLDGYCSPSQPSPGNQSQPLPHFAEASNILLPLAN